MKIATFARRTAVLAATAAVGLSTMFAQPASAASGSVEQFAAQARAAGLTTSQTTALQAEVDLYLKQNGGRQVSPNTIDLAGKGTIRVALPDEAHPRDFSAGADTRVALDKCDGPMYNGWFCAYSKSGYQGTVIEMYQCGLYDVTRFSSGGSWINNQTQGRVARMYDGNLNLIYNTPPAYSSDSTGNWGPVDAVRPC